MLGIKTKIKKIILLFMLFCISPMFVWAQKLTASDIAKFYNEEESFDYELRAVNDILQIYKNEEKLAEIDCSNGYIEYDPNRDSVVINNITNFFDFITFKLNGYSDDIKFNFEDYDPYFSGYSFYKYADLNVPADMYNEELKDAFFDKYGIIETYISLNVYYQKYSLDTDKLDLFVKDFATLKNDLPENIRAIMELKPSVTFENIENTSIKISPRVTYQDLQENKNYCFVYKSTQKDEGYTRITDNKISCIDGIIEDKDIEPGKTYYYKSRLTYTNQYSEPIEVYISKEENNEQDTEEITTTTTKQALPDNPGTGVISKRVPTIIIVSISMTVLLLLELFKKLSRNKNHDELN